MVLSIAASAILASQFFSESASFLMVVSMSLPLFSSTVFVLYIEKDTYTPEHRNIIRIVLIFGYILGGIALLSQFSNTDKSVKVQLEESKEIAITENNDSLNRSIDVIKRNKDDIINTLEERDSFNIPVIHQKRYSSSEEFSLFRPRTINYFDDMKDGVSEESLLNFQRYSESLEEDNLYLLIKDYKYRDLSLTGLEEKILEEVMPGSGTKNTDLSSGNYYVIEIKKLIP